jgi:hypothetical protein
LHISHPQIEALVFIQDRILPYLRQISDFRKMKWIKDTGDDTAKDETKKDGLLLN